MPEVTYLPFLFQCYECEQTHELVAGNYIVNAEPGAGLRDTEFYCIPCATEKFGMLCLFKGTTEGL
jgi:hypothetical protein